MSSFSEDVINVLVNFFCGVVRLFTGVCDDFL